jgi:hypothetical protein
MKLSKLSIFILSLSLVTILTFMFYQIYRFQKRDVVFSQLDAKYTQPLDPSLDPKVLERLRTRNN